MIPEIDVWRAAQLMLKRYGEKAAEKSAARADKLAAASDGNGSATWRPIADAVEHLANKTPPHISAYWALFLRDNSVCREALFAVPQQAIGGVTIRPINHSPLRSAAPGTRFAPARSPSGGAKPSTRSSRNRSAMA
jgi:hypothetical protein